MAWQGGATTSSQQIETVVESLRQVPDRKRLHANRRKLDCKRNPVEAPANVCYRRRILTRQFKTRAGQHGTFDKQTYAFGPVHVLSCCRIVGGRQAQGRNLPGTLA